MNAKNCILALIILFGIICLFKSSGFKEPFRQYNIPIGNYGLESAILDPLYDLGDIMDIQNPLEMKSVNTLDECKDLCDAFGPNKCAGFTLMLGPTFKLCDLKRSCDGIVDEKIDCIASMNIAKENHRFKNIQGCGYRVASE